MPNTNDEWGMCNSAAALCMKGFPAQQTICIRTDHSWRDSFCHCRTLHSHSHKWKHSYTNYVFPIFFPAFAFVILIRIRHKWNLSFRLCSYWTLMSTDSVCGDLNIFMHSKSYWGEWEQCIKMHIISLMDGQSLSCMKVNCPLVDSRDVPWCDMLSMNTFCKNNKNKTWFVMHIIFFLGIDGKCMWTSVFSVNAPLSWSSVYVFALHLHFRFESQQADPDRKVNANANA